MERDYLTLDQVNRIARGFVNICNRYTLIRVGRKEFEKVHDNRLVDSAKFLSVKRVLYHTMLPDYVEVRTEDDRWTYALFFMDDFVRNFDLVDAVVDGIGQYVHEDYRPESCRQCSNPCEGSLSWIACELLTSMNEDLQKHESSDFVQMLKSHIF